MPRRLFHLGIGLFILFALMSSSANAQKAASSNRSTIVVDEDNDGLPGAQVGPSRKDIEDLIKAIGRDPVSDELVDRIDAMFRPRWASPRDFNNIRQVATDPKYIARIDALTRELTQKPAWTRTIINRAASSVITPHADDSSIRQQLQDDLARENAARKTIQGRIVDEETGKPIVGAMVISQGGMMTRTGADGKYVLKTRAYIGERTFSISIEAPGYALTQTMLDWADLGDPEIQDYRLPKASTFGGRVIDPNGKPIVGVELELVMESNATFRDVSDQKRGMIASNGFHAKTDRDGAYAFRNIPPDNGPQQWASTLNVSHPQYQSRVKSYAPNELLGEGWEITLEPGRSVRGLVVDESGKPVPNVQIYAQLNVPGAFPNVTADGEGRFRFDNLPMRTVKLNVQSASHLTATVDVEPVQGEPPETRIVLDPGEYLEGKVVDEDDKPVGGASIGYLTLVDDDHNPKPTSKQLTTKSSKTRDDGTFRVGPVPKGRYRIRAIRSESDNGKSELHGFVYAESGSKDIVVKFEKVAK